MLIADSRYNEAEKKVIKLRALKVCVGSLGALLGGWVGVCVLPSLCQEGSGCVCVCVVGTCSGDVFKSAAVRLLYTYNYIYMYAFSL